MAHYVYMLKCISSLKPKTYVGYTTNYKNRLNKHNSGKGAKSTRGHKWIIIYKKLFYSKTKALKYEYLFKKNRKKRLTILEDYNEQNSKNCNDTSL